MSILAIDSETFLITPRCKVPRLVCVSWADHIPNTDGAWGVLKWDEPNTPGNLETWLNHKNTLIVGHNICFDMAVLAAQYPYLLPLIFKAYDDDRITDTMLRQKLLDIAAGRQHQKYSLQSLAERHLGIHLEKEDTWRLRYNELVDVPLADWPAEARDYAITDATTTLAVYQAQEIGQGAVAADNQGRGAQNMWLGDQYRQARHAFWLHLMSAWGFRTDLAKVAALEAKITAELDAVRGQLAEAGLLRDDGTRDTAVAKARMAQAGSTKLTPKGALSLDDEACRASGDALLVAYAEYTHLAGLLAKDIAALKQGEIHTRVNSLLETGRTSCGGSAEDGGYNTQNPARSGGVRECFISRPGYLLVDSDFDGLELRAVAQVCLTWFGESRLAEALNSGRDPHLVMAAQLMSETYDEAVARYKSGDKEPRQFSKIANFGLAGGMGIPTFVQYAANNGITLDENKAREIKTAWFETWPEFRRYFQRISSMTQNGPCQIEQLYSGRLRGGCGYSQAANGMFQALGADAAKAAGWAITKACYIPGSILYGSRIVAFPHDQFLVEVLDDEHAADRAAEVGLIMVEEANKWLTDVPATTTPALCRCWSKETVAVYNESGRLVPYEYSTLE